MEQIRNMIFVLIMSVSSGTLASCTIWDMVKPSSGLSVDTELVVGDKEQVVHTELATTNNTADNITQNIDNVDYVTLGLLLLSVATGVVGWMAPVPKFLRKKGNEE